MTKFKSIILAAMLATAGLTAQTAQAAVFEIYPDTVGGFSAAAGNTFNNKYGVFTDQFEFSLDHTFESVATLTSAVAKGKDIQILALNIVQYDPTTLAVIKTVTGINDYLTNGVGSRDSWSLDSSWLVAGSYYLEVKGDVLGTNGGSYAVDLNVTAVPEAETYAMMLGGLGLVGFVARRRKASKVAA